MTDLRAQLQEWLGDSYALERELMVQLARGDLPAARNQLARIHILNGEQEKALDVLEPLLKKPYYLSPGWLRIDPTFDPLRNNPRFKKLVKETA